MITKEEFINYITSYQNFVKGIDRIEEAFGHSVYLFETDWYEAVGKMLDFFIESHFTKAGCNTIFWWLFEDVDKIITQTVDPDLFHGKSEIEYDVNNIEDLWNYLIKFSSDYFKQDSVKKCKSNV